MSYAAFFKELAVLAEGLDKLVDEKPEPEGMPIPYLTGKVCVHLDSAHVGYFEISDGYAVFIEEEQKKCPSEDRG